MSGEKELRESLFCCPVCGGPLRDGGRALRCPAGHSFDRAAQGYVNLLPPIKSIPPSRGTARAW